MLGKRKQNKTGEYANIIYLQFSFIINAQNVLLELEYTDELRNYIYDTVHYSYEFYLMHQ